MDVNNQRKPLLYYWLIALLIMGVINMFFLPFMTKNTIEQVNYDVFLTQMQNKNISQAEVNEDVIYFYLKDEGKSDKAGTTIFSENTQKVYSTVRMDDPQLVERLYNAGASFGEVKPREVSPLVQHACDVCCVLPAVAVCDEKSHEQDGRHRQCDVLREIECEGICEGADGQDL